MVRLSMLIQSAYFINPQLLPNFPHVYLVSRDCLAPPHVTEFLQRMFNSPVYLSPCTSVALCEFVIYVTRDSCFLLIIYIPVS